MNRTVSLRIARLLIVLTLFAFLSPRQTTAQEASATTAPETVSQGDDDSGMEESDQEANPQETEPPNPAEEAFRRAMQHEEKNELNDAIADCTEAIQLDPDNIEYLNGRAHVYGEMRNKEQAMADAARVLELDPTNIRARTLRGRLLERSGDAEKALIEFNTAVQQNPTSLEALAERQYFFERQGQGDKAKADAERMVQLQPDSAKGNVARALSGATDDQRINFASAAIQQDPENWYAYKLRGLSKAAEGDFTGAESDFDKALELSPDNALIYSSRGAMYYMQGDYKKSLADSQKAAELEPRNCSIIAILADRLATCPDSNLRDARMASEYAAEALRLDANEPLVWRACASAAAANGNFKEAKKWTERAANSNVLTPNQQAENQDRLLVYNSGQPYIYNVPPVDEVLADKALNQAKEAIRNGNFERAIALCSQVIQQKTKNARAYDTRGLAYLKQDNCDLAIADFTTAVGLNPKDADAYFYRARAFERTREYGKARDDLLKTSDLDPENEMGMQNNLAWFFATCPDDKVRDGKRASAYVKRALELEPNRPSIWDTRAAVFAENGDFENAVHSEQAYIERTDITEDQREDGNKRLALYQQHQAYHNESNQSDLTRSATPSAAGE